MSAHMHTAIGWFLRSRSIPKRHGDGAALLRRSRRRFWFACSSSAVVTLAACSAPDSSHRFADATPRSETTVCVADPARSRAISFSPVALGERVQEGAHGHIIDGPRITQLVHDSAEWQRVWNKTAPAIPVPVVEFHDSVVVLAATALLGHGGVTFYVDAIRQCTATRAIAVAIRSDAAKYPPPQIMTRIIVAVRAPAAPFRDAAVEFVQ